jgi:hypothetical protein
MRKYHKIDTVWKRDEENRYAIQPGEYSSGILEALSDIDWVWHEKVHGRNHRVIFRGETGGGETPVIEHRGKSDNAEMPGFLMNRVEDMFTPDMMRGAFEDTDVCLYGEAYGRKINGGSGYSDSHSFCLFDVRIGEWWLEREDVFGIAQDLGLQYPAIKGIGSLQDACDLIEETVDDKITASIGDTSQEDRAPIEGFILRPAVQLFDRHGKRILSKIKYKDYEKLRGLSK